jgi:hypothetical protein
MSPSTLRLASIQYLAPLHLQAAELVDPITAITAMVVLAAVVALIQAVPIMMVEQVLQIKAAMVEMA